MKKTQLYLSILILAGLLLSAAAQPARAQEGQPSDSPLSPDAFYRTFIALTNVPPHVAIGEGKIVFYTKVNNVWQIFSMFANGTGLTRLTDTGAVDNGSSDDGNKSPVWSPDGTKILFYSNRDSDDGDNNWDIYVINADGTKPVRLTTRATDDAYPTWSPDGKKIVFQTIVGGNWEIYTMNADGTGLNRLTNNDVDDQFPVYTPDGNHIVFSSFLDDEETGDIYIMDADGTDIDRLTSDTRLEEANPVVSPDGKYIAFEGTPLRGGVDIYYMRIDGTGLVNLTNDIIKDSSPAWSPDSKQIAFSSDRGEGANPQLFYLQIDVPGVVKPFNPNTTGFAPDWHK